MADCENRLGPMLLLRAVYIMGIAPVVLFVGASSPVVAWASGAGVRAVWRPPAETETFSKVL